MLTLKDATMLGNVPEGWNVKSLHRLLSADFAGDWGEERGPQMTRVLRSTNLTSDGRLNLTDIALRALPPHRAASLTPRTNDILLERSGGGPGQPVGRVGFVEADMPGHGFSNFLHLLRPDPHEIDARFLGWALHQVNQSGRVVRLEQQTTQMRNLHFRDYLSMPLPVPPPDEQAAIARILDAVDLALGRTRTAIEEAREVKRALVQRAFSEGLRGEPTRKTVIGHVPKSWDVVPVNCVVSTFQYGLSVAMQAKGDLPILRMGNIQNGAVILSDLKFVTLPAKDVNPYRLSRGDVLFNRTNSQEWVGKVGIFRHDTQAVFASYLIRLLPDSAKVDNYYLGHVLGSYNSQCRIKRYATPGVQQVNINATNLGKVLIPLPVGDRGLQEQREIAAILEAADAVVRSYEPVLEAQQSLTKSLMRDLLTGRVRVRDTSKLATS
jgi:type I restriction enzyme S subunit